VEREVQIVCGGQAIELNPFTTRIVLNTLLGLLGSLHGVDTNAEIHLTVKPKGGT
jgi:hypothetical protein